MANIVLEENLLVVPNEGGQKAFAEDWEHHMVGLEGGWMSGKTWTGCRKLIELHTFNAFNWDGDPTYVPSCCVAPSYANAFDFDVPELQIALDEANISYRWKTQGTVANGRFSGPALVLPDFGTHKNPSVILIRSADTPAKITGWQVGAGLGDEPARWREDAVNPKNDAFTQFMGRIRHPDARFVQALFTYTNEGDETRIYEQMNSGKADIALYRAPTRENPRAKNFLAKQLELLTPSLAKQYLEGGASSLRGGKVYPSFDKNVHINHKVKLFDELPLHMSLDFNISPGMHAELGQYIPHEDRFTVVHEIFASRLSVKGVIKELQWWLKKNDAFDRNGAFKWRELLVFGDASGNTGSIGTGETCYDILRTGLTELRVPFRLRVPRANPFIVDRVNCVEMAFMDFYEQSHYTIHPSCVELIDDYQRMKRDKKGIIDKADPARGHSADAEGYRIHMVRPCRTERADHRGQHSVGVF